ncbi:MAG: SAVED domain-containing protein [Bacteriovoracaceae bacterium]
MSKKQPKKKKALKEKRPSISDDVKLELWARAGGRCQFRGCNKPLWYDKITLSSMNQSNIAHIISWTPTGPRGDKIKSPKFAKDIRNLMLMCPQHNKHIDIKKYEAKYTVAELTKYKKEHEKRIAIVTDINSSFKTDLLIFQADIGDRPVRIDQRQTSVAALPYHPTRDEAILIDLTGYKSSSQNYWAHAFEQIEDRTKAILNKEAGQLTGRHISVFALGPIPFLIKFGSVLGNTIPMRLFQKHRIPDNWEWKKSKKADLIVHKNIQANNVHSKDIVLVLSFSGKVNEIEYQPVVKSDWPVIEFEVKDPGPLYLQTEPQQTLFSQTIRQLFSDIRAQYGYDSKIHIFPAVPAPFAVEIGRQYLPKVDPGLVMYERHKVIDKDVFFKVGEI